MGLLTASNTNNQYPTYYANTNTGILFKKADAYGLPKGEPKYVKIDQDQGVFVFKKGRLVDFCFDEGFYFIEQASAPSYSFGASHRQTIDVELLSKTDFPFTKEDEQYLFINFKPLKNCKISPAKQVKVSQNNENFLINFTLSFSLKIADPFFLLKQTVNKNEQEYPLTQTLIDRITNDFRKSICVEIINCCNSGISPKDIAQYANQIGSNAANRIKFLEMIGCFITDINFIFLSALGENDTQHPQEPIITPSISVSDGTEPPSQTETFTIDIEPVTPAMPETELEPQIYDMQNTENYNTVSFDFIEATVNSTPVLTSKQTHLPISKTTNDFASQQPLVKDEPAITAPIFTQTPPPQQIQHFETTAQPNNMAPQNEHTFKEQQTPINHPAPHNSVETTVQSFQKPQQYTTPPPVDVGIDGLNLSYSEMSIKEPRNEAQTANVFFPFGEDKEWLCPCCLNEAIGDFCGFCGQQRVSQFRVVATQSANTEWQCQRCGTLNYLKYCSNCGVAKHQEGESIGFEQQAPRFCPGCGYDFSHLNGATPKFCPECGMKF